MPESFEINSSAGAYRVQVGDNLLSRILADHPESVILVDTSLVATLPTNVKKVISVSATEQNKSIEQIAPIIVQLRALNTGRETHILAIGGGVIQDIATFVASIYMRGISWRYLPTTFLGMVDSCIGGKSSINVAGYKNLVGNFYPPKDIIIDLDFLKTLPLEHVIGGICEAAKICYAKSFEEFEDYLGDMPSAVLSIDQEKSIVIRSLLAKKWFIEVDEFDQNERLLLNFGHTFGHALESGTDFRFTHGIAVGIGMLVAGEYAKQQQLLTLQGINREALLANHVMSLLKHLLNLKSDLQCIEIDRLLDKFDSDKKHQPNVYRVVVPVDNGALMLRSIPRSSESQLHIQAAFESVIKSLINLF